MLLKDDEKVYQVKGHGNINFEVVMTTSCTWVLYTTTKLHLCDVYSQLSVLWRNRNRSQTPYLYKREKRGGKHTSIFSGDTKPEPRKAKRVLNH